MTIRPEGLPFFAFAAVMLSWFAFAAAFLFRKKPPGASERKRDRGSLFGIILQGVAYALVWMIRRSMFSPIAPLGKPLEVGLAIFTTAVAIGSVWLIMAAVRVLGKEWSFAARVVEGHRLVTEGPYRLVRHPIYTGMFGMLVSTALAISHWKVLLPAFLLFLVGTVIRVRMEERLLREEFGTEWEGYTQKVPAVIPGLY